MADELDGRCGSCAAFTRVREDPEKGRIGECALEVYPPPLYPGSACTRYRPKGALGAAPRPRAAGEPRRRYGGAPRAPSARRSSPDAPAIVRRPLPKEIDIDMEIHEFRRVLRQVLAEELGVGEVELGRRWQGGELVMMPGATETQEKRVPIEAFFHKIVMVRDKLRVLEQKINGHKGLSDSEKVQMQQYITACYGSLTTFNLLFADRDDSFAKRG